MIVRVADVRVCTVTYIVCGQLGMDAFRTRTGAALLRPRHEEPEMPRRTKGGVFGALRPGCQRRRRAGPLPPAARRGSSLCAARAWTGAAGPSVRCRTHARPHL